MSISYDRIAYAYDSKNLINPVVDSQLKNDLLSFLAKSNCSMALDVGAGTGRFSIPLLTNGINVVGMDYSYKMLEQFNTKLKGLSLKDTIAQGNFVSLPFRSSQFDAVIVSHVFHLVANWKQAVNEVRRVLKPNGYLLHHWTEAHPDSVREQLKQKWRELLLEYGIHNIRPGVEDHGKLIGYIKSCGAKIRKTDTILDVRGITPERAIGIYMNKGWSDTWNLPEHIHNQASNELLSWVNKKWRKMDEHYYAEHKYYWDIIVFDK